MRHRSLVVPLAAAALAAVAACRTRPPVRIAEAPAPTAPASPAAAATARGTTGTRRAHTAADAQFMRHMLAHHAQALVMTAMVRERSEREEIARMAERIAISQADETRLMEQWLRRRGEAVPASDASSAHAHHGASGGGGVPSTHASMPGMLTAGELARLEQARGAAFDRLFLEFMIRHHEGALTMVATLLATPGAAQQSETYRFAADVDADQRAEIRRMRALLATLGR